MQHFLQFRLKLGSHNLPIVKVGFAASQGLTEYARTVVALLLLMNSTCHVNHWFMNAQFFSHSGNNMLLW